MNVSAAPVAATKAMQCPSCGGAIELFAAGYSTTHVCQYCGSEIDLTEDRAKLLVEHVEAAKALLIPLGTMGVLNGVEWVCVGNMEKTDGWDRWEEFLLFNPFRGYRWLVRTESGWSIGTPILSQPADPNDDRIRYEGKRLNRIYNPADSTVERAIGEFYWRVKRGDKVRSTTYAGNGLVLSCEITRDEYNWTLEEFVSSRVVAEAFGVEDTGQYPQTGSTPSPHQPNPYSEHATNFALVAGIAFVAAMLLSVLLSFEGEQKQASFNANPTNLERSFELGTFTVNGRARPFTITARGEPGDNNWMYLEYTLTNTATDEEIIASQPIQYYYGSDWREDDREGTVKISSVPPGTYRLTAEVLLPEDEVPGARERVQSRQNSGLSWDTPGYGRPITVEVYSNGVFYSNLVLLFLALFAPVIWMAARVWGFESARVSGYDGNDDYDDDD